MKSLFTLLLSALSALACFAQSKNDSLQAAVIFNRSSHAYAHLLTYSDNGQAVTSNSRDNHVQTIIFKTAYINNGNFNFEYYVQGTDYSLYQINRVNKSVKTWWGVTQREAVPQNIGGALGAAAGVSSSTSYIVPRFLLPADFGNANFYKLQRHVAVSGSEKINGIDCFKIKSQWGMGAAVIWIAKQDYLVRKIESRGTIDPTKREAIVRRDIAYLKSTHQDYSAVERSLKILADIRRRDSLRGHPLVPYQMVETITFSPIINSNLKADLFKFKPDRIAGS